MIITKNNRFNMQSFVQICKYNVFMGKWSTNGQMKNSVNMTARLLHNHRFCSVRIDRITNTDQIAVTVAIIHTSY